MVSTADRMLGQARADLPFARDEVLRQLGYRPGRTRPSPSSLEQVADGMRQATGLLQPLLLQADAALECRGPEDALGVPELGLRWRSPALTRVLAGAERVTLFAGTVGGAVGDAVREAFAAGCYARAVVLDACGTSAVAALGERVLAEAGGRAASAGFRLTAPYSPGYQDWDLADTAALLRVLEARRIGLLASDAHYLVPEKSLCGVVGWVRGRQDRTQASGCAICFLPGCRYRRTPPVGPPGVLLPLGAARGPKPASDGSDGSCPSQR